MATSKKGKNRCRVQDCSASVSSEYFFCFRHRKWSLHDERRERANLVLLPTPPRNRRFFCDPCGTVHISTAYTDCRQCGHKTEELD